LKRASKNAEKAKKRVARDDAFDTARAKKIRSNAKAVKAVENAGLDIRSVTNPPDDPSPYDLEAQRLFSKQLVGKDFTPEFFKKGIDSYFREIDERASSFISTTGKVTELSKRRPYTIEGLCVRLGISKGAFMKLAQDEQHGELFVLAQMAGLRIVDRLLDLGLSKEIDPSLTRFYLKNVSDLQDKTAATPSRVGNITFVTVNSRDEYQRLVGEPDGAIDVSAEIVDGGTEGDDEQGV